MDDIKIYTLDEVAEMFKVTRQTIYNYITAGRLSASKIGREYRVTDADIKEFLEATKKNNKIKAKN